VSDPLRSEPFPPLYFLFGIHNHQPVGNFDEVIRDAHDRAYFPFLQLMREFPDIRFTVHTSGTLLSLLESSRPAYLDLLGELVDRGQVELLGGGLYEPILSMLPYHDKIGQIQALSERLERRFGTPPRGMWLAERVWEPHLTKPIAEAGIRYVLLDDSHFELAGLAPDELSGYYLTEEEGVELAVFPISQKVRYLIPFRPPDELLTFLGSRKGAVTCVDDGEKFGVWPGTDRLCYQDGWLRRVLEGLQKAEGIRTATFSDYLATHTATGRVYLPTASYREMGEWALPSSAGQALEDAKLVLSELPRGEQLVRWLRGGFWRNFLVKYPEANDAYRKTLRLSKNIHSGLAGRPNSRELLAARDALWQAQGNDAYWHGVFGGLYLPHLRRAVKSALLLAEEQLRQAEDEQSLAWTTGDLDGDGHEELLVANRTLTLLFRPAAGGCLTEIGYRSKPLDLADVLTRRPELYHQALKAGATNGEREDVRTIHDQQTAKEPGLYAHLEYDPFRRGALQEYLLPAREPASTRAPWTTALLVFPDRHATVEMEKDPEGLDVRCVFSETAAWPIRLEKRVQVDETKAELKVRYRLAWRGQSQLDARWACQWNLSLTAGDAPGRYLTLRGQPSLGSRGSQERLSEVGAIDEWAGVAAWFRCEPRAGFSWEPVETVSLSEAGYERLYQGTALLFAWPIVMEPGGEWEAMIRFEVREIG